MKVSARHWRTSVALVAVVVALLVPATTAFASSNPNPGVLPPQSHPFGLTYSEWSARWWQWDLSIPVHNPPFSMNVNHPLVDLTGAKCGVGQSGKVFFLGGADFQIGTPTQDMVVRNCIVPHGKALFFPPLNIECSVLEASVLPPNTNGCGNPGPTVDQLRSVIAQVMDQATNLAADVDGRAIPIGSATSSPFRVQSPVFSFTLPSDDLLSFIEPGPPPSGKFQPGTYTPMVGDGFYVMLAPLSAGQHTVHFHGEIPAFGFKLDVTYHLTVQ
jgi:hypothetical protein